MNRDFVPQRFHPMIPAARAAAAIEVLSDIESRRRPASDAMKDWGLSHRFAGSGDRAAISGLVYDVLRKQSSPKPNASGSRPPTFQARPRMWWGISPNGSPRN